MKLPVAVQLYSVRDEMEKDFYGTIQKMKDLGYDGVEFAGLFGEEPAKIKEFCECCVAALSPQRSDKCHRKQSDTPELEQKMKKPGLRYSQPR